MGFGFPPSYEISRELAGNRVAAREAIVHAFSVLGWTYDAVDVDHFQGSIPMNGFSWGENVTVSLGDGAVTIESSCAFPLQLFDWGKNKRNVTRFLSHFIAKETRESVLPHREPLYFDESGRSPLDRVLTDQKNEPLKWKRDK